jgi:hypothetical protein
MSWGRLTAFVGLAALLGSCASADQYDFQVAFDPSVVRSRVAIIHTEVRRGGCSGVSVYSVDLGPDGRPIGDGSPGRNSGGTNLDAGRYGLAASIRDNSCVAFAEGCVEVDLPDAPTPVVVTVSPSTESPLCDAAECVVGFCTGVGAGACTPTCSTGFICCGTECCAGTCGACGTGL